MFHFYCKIFTHFHNNILDFSDGGGRSGVYLSIDANLELAEEEDCFNVFGYLKKLRQSRKGLIENVVSSLSSICISVSLLRSRAHDRNDQIKLFDSIGCSQSPSIP